MADWTKGEGKTTLFCPCAPVFVGLFFCFDRLRIIVCLFQGKGQNHPSGRLRTEDPGKSRLAHLPGLGPSSGVPEPSSSSSSWNLPCSENGNDGTPIDPQICRAGGALPPTSRKNRPMETFGDWQETGVPTHDRNTVEKRASLRHPSGCRRADNTCRLDCSSVRGSGDRPDLSATHSLPNERNAKRTGL